MSVLVCLGCHNKVPRTGGLKKQVYFFTFLKVRVRVSAGLVSSEASLLGLQTDGGGRVNQGAAHTWPFRQR